MTRYREWTNKECDRLRQLILDGKNRHHAAIALGRPYSSVRVQAAALGLVSFRPTANVRVAYPTARVPKQLVIDWYELGWRVLGIGATDCVLEWRLGRAPEYPGACVIEATASRILEDA